METIPPVAFVLAAGGLLGSPGPAIAALVAVGRTETLAVALRYYAWLQVGLAAAATLVASGVGAMLHAAPAMRRAMSIVAVAYLLYLAFRIATAPVESAPVESAPVEGAPVESAPVEGAPVEGAPVKGAPGGQIRVTPESALLLGLANPKAYLAFASLFASAPLVERAGFDAAIKLALIVAVMLIVDLAWLLLGGVLGRMRMHRRSERTLNIAMGAAIVAAAWMSLA